MPATQIAAAGSLFGIPRKLGRTAKVGVSLIPEIWGRSLHSAALDHGRIGCLWTGRPPPKLQRLLVEQARHDAVRRQFGIRAKGVAGTKARALVKADRRRLKRAGFE